MMKCVFIAVCIGMLLTNSFAQDPDLDGFSTEIEQLLGTDPQDANSRPTLADNQWKIIAWWPLLEDAEEGLGTGLDGLLKNGAKFRNDALILDGKDDYINFGNAESLNITSNISYCLWLKPEGSWGTQRIIGKFQAKGNERSCNIHRQWRKNLDVYFGRRLSSRW